MKYTTMPSEKDTPPTSDIVPEEAGGKDVVLIHQSYTGYISGDERKEL